MNLLAPACVAGAGLVGVTAFLAALALRPPHGPRPSPDRHQRAPASVSARELRRRGLTAWPAAVGVWWPARGGAGTMVCRDCVEVRPASATAGRPDGARAVVLVGIGARQRVERRCAVHTARPRPLPALGARRVAQQRATYPKRRYG